MACGSAHAAPRRRARCGRRAAVPACRVMRGHRRRPSSLRAALACPLPAGAAAAAPAEPAAPRVPVAVLWLDAPSSPESEAAGVAPLATPAETVALVDRNVAGAPGLSPIEDAAARRLLVEGGP